MSIVFYKSIIEDEIQEFGLKKESLMVAARSVAKAYSPKSLNDGSAFLDYNNPSNRCAYLYKYSTVHSGLVTTYFRKLLRKKQVRSALNKKKNIKICCLGGGPGTDVVGLFKVLAMIPQYHKKVVEVTILDICGGWQNSFKRIISDLIKGKVKDVPETFIDTSKFKFKLIEVNLLEKLPCNVVKVISNADIITMVKFVSAVIGSPSSVEALKVIGGKLKTSAVILFIDNLNENVFKPFTAISEHIGLEIMLGPLHELFKKVGLKELKLSAERKMFGCLPLLRTSVAVLGFMKSNAPSIGNFSNNIKVNFLQNKSNNNERSENSDDDNSWYTNESENLSDKNTSRAYVSIPNVAHKLIQTDTYIADEYRIPSSVQINELNLLVDSLCGLVSTLNEWVQQRIAQEL